MRDLSSQETETLLLGAQKLAAMKELGLSEDQLVDLLQEGAVGIGRAQQRGSSQRGQVFDPRKTQLRSAAERGAAPRGQNIARTVREGGVVRDTPTITPRNVNAVAKRIAQVGTDLKSQGLAADNPRFDTSELTGAGFTSSDMVDEDQTRRVGDRGFQGPEELGIAQERRERAEKRRATREARLRESQPRFDNVMGMGSEEFSPGEANISGRSLEAASQRIEQAMMTGEITPDEGRELSARLLVSADPRLQMGADRSAAQGEVAADSVRFNSPAAIQRRVDNDVMNAVEMESNRRSQPANVRSRALGALGQVNISRNDEVVLDDRGFSGLETSDVISGSNTPNSSNALNAPEAQSSIDWVANQVAGPAGSNYEGRAIQDSDIQGSLGRINEEIAALGTRKVRGSLPFQNAGVDPVRSIAGLQAAVDTIKRVGAEQGVTFPRMTQDPATGKMVARRVAQPGTQEIMEFLGMNMGDQQRLGIALNTLDQVDGFVGSDLTPINLEKQRRFRQGESMEQDVSRVVFGMRDLTGSGIQPEADIATAPTKRAQAFRDGGLSTDASVPFIGQVRGEDAPVRKRPGGVTGEQIAPFLTAKEQEMYQDKGGIREEILARNIQSAEGVDRRAAEESIASQARQAKIDSDRAPFMYGRRFR